jgi:hypothetical protein
MKTVIIVLFVICIAFWLVGAICIGFYVYKYLTKQEHTIRENHPAKLFLAMFFKGFRLLWWMMLLVALVAGAVNTMRK